MPVKSRCKLWIPDAAGGTRINQDSAQQQYNQACAAACLQELPAQCSN